MKKYASPTQLRYILSGVLAATLGLLAIEPTTANAATYPEIDPNFHLTTSSMPDDAKYMFSSGVGVDAAGRMIQLNSLYKDATDENGQPIVKPVYVVSKRNEDGSVVWPSISLPMPEDLSLSISHCEPRVLGSYSTFVVSCSHNALYVWKLREDGTLDPRYGTAGLKRISAATTSPFVAAHVSGDQLVIGISTRVAGSAESAFTIYRLRSDNGEPDVLFGDRGVKRVKFWSQGIAEQSRPVAIALDRKNRIVIVGRTRDSNASGWQFAVTRMDWYGNIDASFADGGTKKFVVTSNAVNYGRTVDIDGNERIVMSGSVGGLDSTELKIGVARLFENGSFDTSLGGTGTIAVGIQGNRNDAGPCLSTSVFAGGLVSNGPLWSMAKIIVAGVCSQAPQIRSDGTEVRRAMAYVKRLNEDGTPFLEFGNGDGAVTYDFGEQYSDVSSMFIRRRDWNIGWQVYVGGNQQSCTNEESCNTKAFIARMQLRIR
jgi:uncharacterized delta-60 repeat protein